MTVHGFSSGLRAGPDDGLGSGAGSERGAGRGSIVASRGVLLYISVALASLVLAGCGGNNMPVEMVAVPPEIVTPVPEPTPEPVEPVDTVTERPAPPRRPEEPTPPKPQPPEPKPPKIVALVDLYWVKDDSLSEHNNLGVWGEDNAGSEVFRVRLTEDLPGTAWQSGHWWSAASLSSPHLSFHGDRTGKALGTVSYSGGVVGVHARSDVDERYGPYFEGVFRALVDLSRPRSVNLSLHRFYKGKFSGRDRFEYTIPFALIDNKVTPTFEAVVPSASSEPGAQARIRGHLYGPDFEGIGGALQDFHNDIAIAVFGGTRSVEE